MTPNDTPMFTEAEIAKMRAFVTEHDKKTSINSFDLNNPPKAPYRHQELPRLLYNHGTRKHKLVHKQSDLDAALADGFQIEPFPAEPLEPVQLDAAEEAEVAKIDAEARKKKAAKAR